ncbi:MAG: PLP-dependent aminotransferase family protein [Pseudobutyrivibrio sp.]|nr:PLP-dependent aminotransferase family protein [Pseudobutyrivibrio sp.]
MKVYEKVYEYYVNQIKASALKPGDRMPSMRESEKILNVSRTSIETAYLQLAADGYIYSVEKVGYFVSETVARVLMEDSGKVSSNKSNSFKKYQYDLATIGEDKSISCLQLWRRYMKSALRQEDRLLSYASNQGELELREEIAVHVRKTRNIICTPEDIVIGAGFQNLLQILIALIPGVRTISFPTRDFADGAFTFENAGFQVSYRNKDCHVIYVAPSYMNKWGEVMTMKRRHEIIEHVIRNSHLLIEDDYQNDFVYSSRPTPSLYAMTGGENTAFLGSFSRVLLPSVRISYLILPRGTREKYNQIKDLYNQTASKAEQIALAQFIRDGHLNRHIKKIHRHYGEKRQIMLEALREYFSAENLLVGDSGMEIGLRLNIKSAKTEFEKEKLFVNVIEEAEDYNILLLSCSLISMEDIKIAIKRVYDIYNKCFVC